MVELTSKQLQESSPILDEWNADMAKVGVLHLCLRLSLFYFFFLSSSAMSLVALKSLLYIY